MTAGIDSYPGDKGNYCRLMTCENRDGRKRGVDRDKEPRHTPESCLRTHGAAMIRDTPTSTPTWSTHGKDKSRELQNRTSYQQSHCRPAAVRQLERSQGRIVLIEALWLEEHERQLLYLQDACIAVGPIVAVPMETMMSREIPTNENARYY
jgi:hypothetical protein